MDGRESGAIRCRIVDRGLFDAARPGSAYAQVDDVGPFYRGGATVVAQAGCITNALDQVVGCAAAHTEHSNRHDTGTPTDPRNALGIVAGGRDRAGNMGAVETTAGPFPVPFIGGVGIDTVTIGGGIVVYCVSAWLLKIPEWQKMVELLKRRLHQS